MAKFLRMTDLDLKGKRVFIRADLNVPVKEGKVTSDARITASMPTIEHAMKAGAKVMVTSHLGRPTEGEWTEEVSLQPVADNMAAKLGKPVRLIKDWVDGGFDVAEGEVVVLENCRVNKGEKKNVEETARKYAALCDVFVMDAFGTAHRAEASTYGVAQYAPTACAGKLVARNWTPWQGPGQPGPAHGRHRRRLQGLHQADRAGSPVREVRSTGGRRRHRQHLPGRHRQERRQVAVRGRPDPHRPGPDHQDDRPRRHHPHRRGRGVRQAVRRQRARRPPRPPTAVADDDMIFDIGPKSAQELVDIIMKAGTVVWNGPVGVFEFDQFGEGTKAIAMAIAETKAFTLAGGGDTIAAIQKYDIYDKVSYISTAGGAFLEYLEGKVLPAVDILEKRAAN
jgi:phosphoglycerate kinase